MPLGLITGSAGFLGQALVRALLSRGWRVRPTARTPRDGCEVLDVTDATAVARAMTDCDAVFNLAARRAAPMRSLAETTQVNTLGAANVLSAAARMLLPPSVVLVGSSEEYGHAPLPFREDGPALPLSAYGASKLAATEIARAAASAVPVVVVRPAVVYGAGQPAHQLVACAVHAALTGGVCVLNGGTQTRDLVYVDDVTEALILAAEQASGRARGLVINAGSGKAFEAREVAHRVIALTGSGKVECGPRSTRQGDIQTITLDVTRAREVLQWSATTSLEDGLRRTLEVTRQSQQSMQHQ